MDIERLRTAAKADPARNRFVYEQVLRETMKLQYGMSDGHHALSYEPGKGDMRDCVTSYVQSDPQRKPDHRLVFREMPPERSGGLPRRELLAARPRHGSGNAYEHTLARLNRRANDQQPGLDVFGERTAGPKANQANRQADMTAKRAVALAYAGQQPLPTSKPFDPAKTGAVTASRTGAAAERQSRRTPGAGPGR